MRKIQEYLVMFAVAAYSYMALVPIVQPLAIKLVTTKKERCIHMDYRPENVSKTMRIVFPIAVTMIVGLVAPQSVALVGFLMFGNLIRECGVLGTMSETAQNHMNMITVMQALEIMWKGMLGIFVALIVIMAFVWIMAKLGNKKDNTKEDK